MNLIFRVMFVSRDALISGALLLCRSDDNRVLLSAITGALPEARVSQRASTSHNNQLLTPLKALEVPLRSMSIDFLKAKRKIAGYRAN